MGRMLSGRALPVAPNIYATVAHNPLLLTRMLDFGVGRMTDSVLGMRRREVAILRTAINCGALYEWTHHANHAAERGVTTEDLRAVVHSPDETTDRDIALIIRCANELHHGSVVTDETWAGLTEVLASDQIMELLFVIGHYHLVAFVLNSTGVQVEDGVATHSSEEPS